MSASVRATFDASQDFTVGIEQIRSFELGPSWLHTNPHVLGRARAPERAVQAAATPA